MTNDRPSVFAPGSWAETGRIASILRKETVGGALLLLATLIALVWANTGLADSYFAFRDTVVGPASLHLNLSLGAWAADGLLAIFFFVAGLELKREFVAGDLRDPTRAIVPIAAAVGGMIVPAVLYLAFAGGAGPRGWAIPTATDIAFALAVLAVDVHASAGAAAHVPAHAGRRRRPVGDHHHRRVLHIRAELPSISGSRCSRSPSSRFSCSEASAHWWLLLPLAAVTWALVHASGVHATVAGVLLGFAVPVRLRSRKQTVDEARSPRNPGLAEHLEHVWRPISAGIAVPIFAFFSAGVLIGGWSGLQSALSDPIAVGIVAGLVVGKPIGILAATFLTSRLTRRPLQAGLTWPDVTGVAVLGGIGFTVSLLIGELAFGGGTVTDDHAKVAVLTGSVAAAVLAAVLLRIRNRRYRALCDEENRDDDQDGIPDIYEQR